MLTREAGHGLVDEVEVVAAVKVVKDVHYRQPMALDLRAPAKIDDPDRVDLHTISFSRPEYRVSESTHSPTRAAILPVNQRRTKEVCAWRAKIGHSRCVESFLNAGQPSALLLIDVHRRSLEPGCAGGGACNATYSWDEELSSPV